MQDYSSNLDQASRLEFAPIACHAIELDECVTISSPSNGFRMPSMEAVRMNDARLSLFASHHEASDESDDDESDDENDIAFSEFTSVKKQRYATWQNEGGDSFENELCEQELVSANVKEAEHLIALPSKRPFGQAIKEAYYYGYSND